MDLAVAPDRALLARWIESDPDNPGIDDARLRESCVPVWAIVGYLPAAHGDRGLVAREYGIPIEAVDAALTYYSAHREAIDSRLAANSLLPD